MCVFLRICVLTCGLGSVHTKQQTEGNEGSQTEDEAARWGGTWGADRQDGGIYRQENVPAARPVGSLRLG